MGLEVDATDFVWVNGRCLVFGADEGGVLEEVREIMRDKGVRDL